MWIIVSKYCLKITKILLGQTWSKIPVKSKLSQSPHRGWPLATLWRLLDIQSQGCHEPRHGDPFPCQGDCSEQFNPISS